MVDVEERADNRVGVVVDPAVSTAKSWSIVMSPLVEALVDERRSHPAEAFVAHVSAQPIEEAPGPHGQPSEWTLRGK